MTDKEYKEAISRINEIFDATPDMPEFEELKALSVGVDEYETLRHRFTTPEEIEEKLKDERFDGSVVFGDDGKEYFSAILGYTEGNNIIYSYELMIDDLARRYMDDGLPEEEAWTDAQEWIDYNTLRAIPYAKGVKPIVVASEVDEYSDHYVDLLTDEVVEFTFF